MTQGSPVEVIRALYATVEDADHAGMRELLASDLRWRQAGSVVPAAGAQVVGADALTERVLEPIERTWDGFTEKVDELTAMRETVVATGAYHGRHRETGRELHAEFCHVWQVRDGVASGFRQYTDTAAFAASMDAGSAPEHLARGRDGAER